METRFIGNMPHSIEAERAVLAAMLIDGKAINATMEMLSLDDFYSSAHKEIYNAMLDLDSMSINIDLTTLSNRLEERRTLENIGGYTYLAETSMSAGASANIRYYCKIVKDKSTLRKLIHSSEKIKEMSFAMEDDVDRIIEKAETEIFNIADGKNSNNLEKIEHIILRTHSIIEDRYRHKGEITGIVTGYLDLDKKLNGMQRKDLILLAARPSMGKTALALNIVANAAKKNFKVAVFSLEMSKEQLVQRIISFTGNVRLDNLMSGMLEDDDLKRIIDGASVLSNSEIYIDDTASISLGELKAKCRNLKIMQGLDLIVIDYLQLMQGDGRRENRQQEISAISRGLKILAKEMDAPVLALSQLSRAAEQRSDHRPMLSDLRESGAIEQDADVVMFIYRDSYYDKETENANVAEVIISKHRNGPTGKIELIYKSEFTKFLDLEKQY